MRFLKVFRAERRCMLPALEDAGVLSSRKGRYGKDGFYGREEHCDGVVDVLLGVEGEKRGAVLTLCPWVWEE